MERIEREEEKLRRRCANKAKVRIAHAYEVNLVVAMLDQERQWWLKLRSCTEQGKRKTLLG